MHKPNWKSEEDYYYVNDLTNIGWAWEFLRRNPEYVEDWEIAVQQQQRFLEFQKDNKFNSYKNPYVIFDPPLPSGQTPYGWVTKEGVTFSAPMKWYGKKWRLIGHIHNPKNGLPPRFDQAAAARMLDWDEMGEYYNPVEEHSEILRQSSNMLIVGIDLSRSMDAIKADIGEIIKREKALRDASNIPQIQLKKRSNWPYFLRILDAKSQKASLSQIGMVLLPEMGEADAKTKISQYVNDEIARILKPDFYIRLANTPG